MRSKQIMVAISPHFAKSCPTGAWGSQCGWWCTFPDRFVPKKKTDGGGSVRGAHPRYNKRQRPGWMDGSVGR